MEGKINHKIAMSGASGFVGSHLTKAFHSENYEVLPLGRKDFTLAPEVLAERIDGTDILINLAGAPIIEKWTETYKETLYKSRIDVTRKLVYACSLVNQKPKLLISTSAIGYYATEGTHSEENHVKANDFLGNLAGDWEQEALKAGKRGIRTVIFRFGVVLGKDGGALKKMLFPFKLGIGGTIGDGKQPFSWVHIDDLLRAYQAVIENTAYEGIYNLTAFNPTTNKGLTVALGKALCKPTFFRVPKFALRLKLGEGSQILTKGQNVIPKRLMDSGFTFLFPEIETAVSDCVS
ncbi:MAG: TIGR01777 family protein [Candidatus Scalindua sp. AMX11]|nr:MAG: TIGR01777 family protein [Candidatus Scalindua sp.]NOG83821.1 TIGR01777 family protein [Planctomycetota bacterium]RZV82973.1 MAG: TIGR01777 family protein [Candidatus Scalindua sp. SCAELEC01]TDE64403.1 MAG: TIGR01777 family protein [Candidatus Scalindua sp. AMX11]